MLKEVVTFVDVDDEEVLDAMSIDEIEEYLERRRREPRKQDRTTADQKYLAWKAERDKTIPVIEPQGKG